jgi:hypothetical protein
MYVLEELEEFVAGPLLNKHQMKKEPATKTKADRSIALSLAHQIEIEKIIKNVA